MTDTTHAVAGAPSEDAGAIVAKVAAALKTYGEAQGLRGLEGRVQRGLDPVGMLAVPETRARVEKITEALGASMQQVEALTKELHVGAIWKNGEALAQAKDPAVQVWMILADACTGDNTGDLDPAGFVRDMENVQARLDRAATDAKAAAAEAIRHHVDQAKEKFDLEDGVPVSRTDDAFLHMAIAGHEAGVVVDADGLAFVGADTLDFEGVAGQFGLVKIQKEDRGRMSTFYVQQGAGADGTDKDVIKQLYPGFGIVLTGDLEITKALARTGMKQKQTAIADTRGAVGEIVS